MRGRRLLQLLMPSSAATGTAWQTLSALGYAADLNKSTTTNNVCSSMRSILIKNLRLVRGSKPAACREDANKFCRGCARAEPPTMMCHLALKTNNVGKALSKDVP